MAINTTLQVGAPVQYTQVQQSDSTGATNQTTEVCAAQCTNNAGIAGAGHPIDLIITGSPSGSNVGKQIKGVAYSAAAANGCWTPLTSASNFA